MARPVDVRCACAEYAGEPSEEASWCSALAPTPKQEERNPMRDFLASRRPSPAMAVAFIALLAALSGTAIALPGTNTVDSGDIKNGAVKTKDIKNNDVRSGDVRNNALTGADINESTLGQVPSANSANSANTANTANSANTANTANSANTATNANNADTLDTIDSGGFVQVKTRIRSISDTTEDVNYANDANLAQLSNLAAGQYAVMAKLQVDNDGAVNNELINCDLVASTGVLTVLDTSLQSLGANASSAQTLNYVFVAQFTAGAAGTDDLFLRCQQTGADNDADEMRIVAQLVNN
jgi:hypothetical protein